MDENERINRFIAEVNRLKARQERWKKVGAWFIRNGWNLIGAIIGAAGVIGAIIGAAGVIVAYMALT